MHTYRDTVIRFSGKQTEFMELTIRNGKKVIIANETS